MTLKKGKPKTNMGDVRGLHNHVGVWAGLSRSDGTGGIHAVTLAPDALGAREGICGLRGRFVVDERLTHGKTRFTDVEVAMRCSNCHTAWLDDHKSK